MGKYQIAGLAILAGVPVFCGLAYWMYTQGNTMMAYVLAAVTFTDLVIGLAFFAKGKPSE
jgi:hypothetical protein